jgi:hypothetical protein
MNMNKNKPALVNSNSKFQKKILLLKRITKPELTWTWLVDCEMVFQVFFNQILFLSLESSYLSILIDHLMWKSKKWIKIKTLNLACGMWKPMKKDKIFYYKPGHMAPALFWKVINWQTSCQNRDGAKKIL